MKTKQNTGGVRQNPGIASLAEVARHWRVSAGSAKKILGARGAHDTGLRPRPTYRWTDIWRIEGAGRPAPEKWPALKEPLLKPKDLERCFPELSARTIRRDLADGRWPVIDLGERTRRVRLNDIAAELELRAGTRSARRKAAGEQGLKALAAQAAAARPTGKQ